MKWIKRTLLGLLLAFVLLLAAAAAVIGSELLFGPTASDYATVSYSSTEGEELLAYLALPEGEGPFPAVLMVHEWWGLNEEIVELADAMAAEGYVVLAMDTYRGSTTRLIPRAIMLRVTVDTARVDRDMQTAFDYLTALDIVDAGRVGVLGFCYGGGVALRHAVRNPAIAATINLYGDTITDPAAFGALLEADAGPVLGIFGAQDQQIPPERARAFEAALQTAGIAHRVLIYDGVGHAFVQPDSITTPGPAAEAWQEMLAFLDENLKAAAAR